VEGIWNSGRVENPNLAIKSAIKKGIFLYRLPIA